MSLDNNNPQTETPAETPLTPEQLRANEYKENLAARKTAPDQQDGFCE